MRRATMKDMGYGIGSLSWNDLRIDKKQATGDGAVRELIVRDVCGDAYVRLDLDTMQIEGVGWWSHEQIVQVAQRMLATIGRKVGDAFGCFYESTTFGLYNGRKPRWMDNADWRLAMDDAAQIAGGAA